MQQQGLLSGMRRDTIMGYFEEKKERQNQYNTFTHFVAGFICGGVTLIAMFALGRLLFGSPECVINNGIC